MNNQEVIKAIKSLKNIVEYWTCRPTEVEAAKIAISALEKQIPIKPLEVRLKHDFQGSVILKDGYCPNCKHEISNAYLFCDKCGQAIDWRNEDE